MSKEKRFVIQVDPLEIEDDAIYDNKELKLYECQSDMMSDICSLLNKQDQQISDLEAKLKALQNGFIDDETLNMLVKEHKLYKDLEAKLAESEKQIKDAREAGNMAVDSWCKNRRRVRRFWQRNRPDPCSR